MQLSGATSQTVLEASTQIEARVQYFFRGPRGPTGLEFISADSSQSFSQGVLTRSGELRLVLDYNNLTDATLILETGARSVLAPVANVPEPATWALMLAGVAVIGLNGRLRPRVT